MSFHSVTVDVDVVVAVVVVDAGVVGRRVSAFVVVGMVLKTVSVDA